MTTLAAALQLLIALAFVTIPAIRHRFGAGAQAAAEAELDRQGVRASILAENKIRFDAGGHETVVPATVAVVMVIAAAFNLAGSSAGEVLTWIFQPLVLLGSFLILYSQVTAARSVEAAFAKKGDPELQRIDVKALLTASERGFPSWVIPGLQNVRHATVIVGSVAVLVLIGLG